jgi:hypothetical protein
VAVAEAAEGPGFITATITRERLETAREQLPVLANRRFNVEPTAVPIQTTLPTT